MNTPIQGTAADILKLALGRLIVELPDYPWLRPLLQIHDELVFELPADKVEEATALIRSCMEAQPSRNLTCLLWPRPPLGRARGTGRNGGGSMSVNLYNAERYSTIPTAYEP